MTRRKGEFQTWQIDAGWPYQVAVPVVDHSPLTHSQPSECHRGHEISLDDKRYRILCFADRAEAERFLERMRGAWCSITDRKKRSWQPDEDFLRAAHLSRISAGRPEREPTYMHRWGDTPVEPSAAPAPVSSAPAREPFPGYSMPLSAWPWSTVRFVCDHCSRGRAVRLSRLEAIYGLHKSMEDIIQIWIRYCPRDPRRQNIRPQKYSYRCTAYIDMHMADVPGPQRHSPANSPGQRSSSNGAHGEADEGECS